MKTPLTTYGHLAERHWRQFCPRLVAELEAKGQLHTRLREAEEKTGAELDSLRRHFVQQGLTPRQAHDRAWEIVRGRYLFLSLEEKYTRPRQQSGFGCSLGRIGPD